MIDFYQTYNIIAAMWRRLLFFVWEKRSERLKDFKKHEEKEFLEALSSFADVKTFCDFTPCELAVHRKETDCLYFFARNVIWEIFKRFV